MNLNKNSAFAVCLAISFLTPYAVSAAPQPSTKPEVRSEATLNSVPVNGEPVIITAEDRARGKENVKNVLEELQQLFAKETYTIPKRILGRKIAPAYCKVINGEDGKATLVYRPRFTTAKKLYKAIDGIAAGYAAIEVIEERNTIIVSDKKSNINYYKELAEAIDIPSSQILVEAKVVELIFNDGMERNLSISYTSDKYKAGAETRVPGSTATDGLNGSFTPVDDLNISFRWLQTATDARVVSSPNILISRNEVARIVTAQEIPIQEANTVSNSISFSTTYKRVGVTLEVEPQMINDDNVTLRLYPQVSSVLRYEAFPISGASDQTYPVPVISVRSIESYLRMQNKQVVMLGGLYSNRDTLQEERIPVLSDIPLIGEIFTGKNHAREVIQLVFFVKVHIVSPDDVLYGFMYDPNEQMNNSEKVADLVVDNPDIKPKREKAIVGLVDEMVQSLDKSWEPVSNERRKRDGNPDKNETDKNADKKTVTPEVKKDAEKQPVAPAAPAKQPAAKPQAK
ncbi:MAG: hypothetical protein IKB71_11115 [Lentisphaeria bacterium]|nr:hypothetical protein [Lentisphaeria bacterium]